VCLCVTSTTSLCYTRTVSWRCVTFVISDGIKINYAYKFRSDRFILHKYNII